MEQQAHNRSNRKEEAAYREGIDLRLRRIETILYILLALTLADGGVRLAPLLFPFLIR